MRQVIFEGHTFDVCDNERELKKEMFKRHGDKNDHEEYHHIFGRVGIMKLMPDNVIPIHKSYHIWQKSTSMRMRILFNDVVEQKISNPMYDRLNKLADHIKNKDVLYGK